MRRVTDRHIGCPLTSRERAVVNDMKARTSLTTDANLVRTALYRFAVHLNEDFDIGLFSVRSARGKHEPKTRRRSRDAR